MIQFESKRSTNSNFQNLKRLNDWIWEQKLWFSPQCNLEIPFSPEKSLKIWFVSQLEDIFFFVTLFVTAVLLWLWSHYCILVPPMKSPHSLSVVIVRHQTVPWTYCRSTTARESRLCERYSTLCPVRFTWTLEFPRLTLSSLHYSRSGCDFRAYP